ncbi:MAG TPA: hypothetical protein VMB23_01455 [Spirochaetia bacterium]|nr:hypothetical protein [Spirochaetia bacterium]
MRSTDERDLQISQNTLRLLIGVLGTALPVFLVLGAQTFLTSVSDYYYTNMRDSLEGVLFFLAVFLAAYRPYGQDGWHDDLITTVSGGFALLIALFPTVNVTLGHVPTGLVLPFIPIAWSGTLHNVGAGGLFVCFAVMSLFYFTKGKKGSWTKRKVLRNAVYIVCGLGIAGCIGSIGWGAVTAHDQKTRDLMPIFWPEAGALVLFGFSWLVKGGLILRDQPAK